MENCLVITALGQDRPGIVSDLSQAVLDTGCNILDSRMTVLGGEFAMLLMVSGNWNAIAKLESSNQSLGQKFNLSVTTKRTNDRSDRLELLPYAVDVVSIDHPGIVNQLAGFFSERSINIEDLRTDCYSAPHTGTSMFTVSLVIGIPASTHIASLREQFISFCDEYNLDAILEPVKA